MADRFSVLGDLASVGPAPKLVAVVGGTKVGHRDRTGWSIQRYRRKISSRRTAADDDAGTSLQRKFIWIFAAISMCSRAAVADDLPDCRTIRDAGKKFQCLEDSIAILQKQAKEKTVEMGTRSFGENRMDSLDWSLHELPGAELRSWTSPPISFPLPFATKPSVSVAVAGIESGANLNVDRFGFSVEATDIDATSFKVAIRRFRGALYGVTVTWLAYGAEKPAHTSAR